MKTFHQLIEDRIKRDIFLRISININTIANVFAFDLIAYTFYEIIFVWLQRELVLKR